MCLKSTRNETTTSKTIRPSREYLSVEVAASIPPNWIEFLFRLLLLLFLFIVGPYFVHLLFLYLLLLIWICLIRKWINGGEIQFQHQLCRTRKNNFERKVWTVKLSFFASIHSTRAHPFLLPYSVSSISLIFTRTALFDFQYYCVTHALHFGWKENEIWILYLICGKKKEITTKQQQTHHVYRKSVNGKKEEKPTTKRRKETLSHTKKSIKRKERVRILHALH